MNGRRRRCVRAVLVVVLCAMLLPVASPQAAADGGPSGSDLHVAQTLGPRELTVVVRRVDAVPGPLRVEVVTHAGSPEGRLELRLAAQNAAEGLPPPGEVSSEAKLRLGARPGSYGSTLQVDRPGPWQLTIDDGTRTSRIPFVVPAQVLAPAERVTYGGFVAAGALLLLALVLAMRARRGWMPLVPAVGMVAAVAVAVTGALLSAATPAPPQPGRDVDPNIDNVTDPYADVSAPLADYSRPPVNVVVDAPGAVAGKPTDLRLELTDGSTGHPVDDLLVHDGALIHLVVVAPSGRLWHLHPARVAAGEYRAYFVPPEDGRYAVSAELSRRGGGVQLVRPPGGVKVGEGTTKRPTGPRFAGTGVRTVHGMRVELTTDRLGAGTASTVTAKVGNQPDLQPWLGMAGHLLIAGPLPEGRGRQDHRAAPYWAHVHAMAPTSSMSSTVANALTVPDETVAAFGPEVRFTYTFPRPGRYRLWIQVERDYRVHTIPLELDVPPADTGERP